VRAPDRNLRRASDEDCARIDPAQVARSCETLGRPLDRDQVAAVSRLPARRRRLVRRARHAGAGTTSAVGTALRVVYEDAAYNVIGVAPTGVATQALEFEARFQSPAP